MKPEVATISLARGVFVGDRSARIETEQEQLLMQRNLRGNYAIIYGFFPVECEGNKEESAKGDQDANRSSTHAQVTLIERESEKAEPIKTDEGNDDQAPVITEKCCSDDCNNKVLSDCETAESGSCALNESQDESLPCTPLFSGSVSTDSSPPPMGHYDVWGDAGPLVSLLHLLTCRNTAYTIP